MFDSMGRKFTKRKPPRALKTRGISEEERKRMAVERERMRVEWMHWNRMVDRINALREFVGIRKTRPTGETEL